MKNSSETSVRNHRKDQVSKKRLTGAEIMALPSEERHRRLEEQVKKAAIYYRTDPELIFEANDDILEY